MTHHVGQQAVVIGGSMAELMAERVADITAYRFPTSLRHHYERLTTVPEGLVVLGDAISSVNPFYGQGMSAAALQVQALQQVLSERAVGA